VSYSSKSGVVVDRLRVAQENVVIINDSSLVPDGLLFMAGKFFKRFDAETCTFVSNIKEYYPDD
jgi:F-box protein 21